ncbi:MAG: STAS domain-containing protein [Spirochaetes bacterium]|nr:STAS domain-containing protein [Spirochaetota bacterium]
MIQISTESVNGTSVISLSGKLNLSTTRTLESTFKEALLQSPKAVYLDMSKTDYVDSSGIGAIIRCMNWAKKENVEFACADLTDDVLSVFKIAKLDSYIKVVTLKEP